MYTDGTSALKKEYYSNAPLKNTKKVKRVSQSVPKRVNIKLLKKRVVCAMLLAFVMAFTVLFRYAAIATEYSKLSKAREKLELLNANVVEKQVVATGNLDPKKIELEAQRLGLHQPTKSQIKYISLGNTDKGEVIKAEETTGFAAFINGLSDILEYLY